MTKPTPAEVAKLRDAQPQGAPRFSYREMTLSVDRAAAAEPNRDTVSIALSSEAPVWRFDPWTGEEYWEVLDHSPTSVDLAYAADGLPFVMSHQAWDGDQQHGLAENVTVGDDRLLRGDVRFSRAVRSQEIKQDMIDGIRKKVSVGYIVGDQFEQTKEKDGEIPTRRYTNWMPIEVSTVPVPADYSVGIGRAKSDTGQAQLARFIELHPKARAESVAETGASVELNRRQLQLTRADWK